MTPPPGALAGVPEAEAAELFETLTSLLWRERELLERLLYTLTVQRVLFEAEVTRYFERADAAVRTAAAALQEHELLRATETEQIVRRYRLPGEASLHEIAMIAPEPWPLVLHEHRDALRSLTDEIDEVAEGSRQLLAETPTGLEGLS